MTWSLRLLRLLMLLLLLLLEFMLLSLFVFLSISVLASLFTISMLWLWVILSLVMVFFLTPEYECHVPEIRVLDCCHQRVNNIIAFLVLLFLLSTHSHMREVFKFTREVDKRIVPLETIIFVLLLSVFTPTFMSLVETFGVFDGLIFIHTSYTFGPILLTAV